MSTAHNKDLRKAADVLAHDHSEVDALIHELLATLEEGNKAQSFERLDLLWARLAMHIRAENLCLFPTILDVLAGSQMSQKDNAPSLNEARQAIAKLRTDHDFFMRELASAVKRMRELLTSRGSESEWNILRDIRQSIAALSDRLAAHNRVEEGQVYRWPNMLLDPTEQSVLTERVQREIENLPPRFDNQIMAEE